MTKVSFIGLGVMGYPMAGHLARAGYQVAVYNRTAAKAQKWAAEYAGRAAPTPAEAARDCDLVFACVGADDDLREVTKGPDGAFAAMKKGAIFVDHTTASAAVERELAAEAQQLGLGYLDAPISGGQSGAEKGILTVMVGGEESAYRQAEPLLKAYGRMLHHMGPVGSGQLTKMMNQIAIAGVMQSLAESLNFGLTAGLDVPKAIEALSGGVAATWFLSNRAQTMIEDRFDFGFTVDWMRKDFGICLDEARHNGAPLPVLALVDQFYAELHKAGDGKKDVSCLIRRFRK